MSERSRSSKSCKSRYCEERRDQDHDRCARHAPCSSSGTFDPGRCTTCAKLATEVLKTSPSEVQQHPYWILLRDQYENAARLYKKYKEKELPWASNDLAALFSNGNVNASAENESVVEQQIAVEENFGDSTQASKQGSAKVSEVAGKKTRSRGSKRARKGSSRGSSRSSKRSRRITDSSSESESDSHIDQEQDMGDESSMPRQRSLISCDDQAASQGERACDPEFPPDVNQIEWEMTTKETANLKLQGWVPAPATWKIWEQAEGQLSAFETVEEDGAAKLTQIQNIDLKHIESPNGPLVFWRSRKSELDPDAQTPFQKIKALGNALCNMSTLLKTKPITIPNIEIADIRANNVSLQASLPISSTTTNFEVLSNWWKTKAVYSAAQPPSNTPGQTNAKVNIRWPADSDYEKMSKFLAPSKITKTDFPKDFTPKDMDLITKDNQARQRAFTAWQTSSILDLLSDMLSAASKYAAPGTAVDNNSLLLQLASQAVTGVAAMLAPHTQHLMEDAITKRFELRSNTIPSKLKSVENKLLGADPFSEKPCGSGESFQQIANDAPQPIQVTLPPQFYSAINRAQTSIKKNSFFQRDNRSKFSPNGNYNARNKFQGNSFRGRQNNYRGNRFNKAGEKSQGNKNQYKDKDNKEDRNRNEDKRPYNRQFNNKYSNKNKNSQ